MTTVGKIKKKPIVLSAETSTIVGVKGPPPPPFLTVGKGVNLPKKAYLLSDSV